MAPRLLVAISSHGYGHVAQVAPVVNALRAQVPGLSVTLRTGVAPGLLETRFRGPFALQPEADDFGMRQRSALEVDVGASAADYRQWHCDWERRVDRVAARISEADPHLVLADVPYLSLAAAERAGAPAIALCSLNWMEIYAHYCGTEPEAQTILAQMESAYRSARMFLRPMPSMPMDSLPNARAIGPIAHAGMDRRALLGGRLGLGPHDRLVLVALGGIATRLPAESWPRLPGVRWIFQYDWAVERDDALVFEQLGVSFPDLLASCDLLFTKPGYGSFMEAAAVGVPVLYVERNDWPESAALTTWMQDRGHARGITTAQAQSGHFVDELRDLLEQERPAPQPMTGVDEAAALLKQALSHG